MFMIVKRRSVDERLFYLCDGEDNHCGGYLGLVLL